VLSAVRRDKGFVVWAAKGGLPLALPPGGRPGTAWLPGAAGPEPGGARSGS